MVKSEDESKNGTFVENLIGQGKDKTTLSQLQLLLGKTGTFWNHFIAELGNIQDLTQPISIYEVNTLINRMLLQNAENNPYPQAHHFLNGPIAYQTKDGKKEFSAESTLLNTPDEFKNKYGISTKFSKEVDPNQFVISADTTTQSFQGGGRYKRQTFQYSFYSVDETRLQIHPTGVIAFTRITDTSLKAPVWKADTLGEGITNLVGNHRRKGVINQSLWVTINPSKMSFTSVN